MDNLNLRGMTFNHVNAGFVLGTTKSITTTATTVCSIGGVFATGLTALTNSATVPTTDAATGLAFPKLTDNQATVLVFGVNAAGAIQLCQGSIEPTAVGITTTAGAFINGPQFPALPDDFCPIAYGLVRTAPSAADWTAGTDNWTATGVTCSVFKNVAVLPARPQIV